MPKYWRTWKGISRLRLAFSDFLRLVVADIRSSSVYVKASQLAKMFGLFPILKRLFRKNGIRTTETLFGQIVESTKPVIFVSACVDEKEPGGWKYNGGIKELNYLVKLLRQHGYEAYMVTYDGTYEPWLIEHQPHISISEFCSKRTTAKNVRCVTSYAVAKAFIDESPNLYFWDMELALTDQYHFSVLSRLYKHKIKNVAAISKTIQAWHMIYFRKPCTLIPTICDESLWFPIESERRARRIGYINEEPNTPEYIELIQKKVCAAGFDLEFYLLEGSESNMLMGTRSCEIYLGMNLGKDSLWGEGCPQTIIEALSLGCVVVAFDVIGNREMIQHNFNGVLISRPDPDLMAGALIALYKNPDEINRMRHNALSLIEYCHTFDARWPAVSEFLNLDDKSSYSVPVSYIDNRDYLRI